MQITANSELGVLSWWAKKRKNTFGDEDIKEFFAMKNLAHFTYENESFA